ncbi:hypothetical protein L484_021384 [Morus notabilis]|uniref:Uncharacterized protein n=1 Tax=Morus notabilis TaxID=981085 RepID=W9S6I3_9ROSA|nr:hypothetical protein L484_021384 [Morus notabilis]
MDSTRARLHRELDIRDPLTPSIAKPQPSTYPLESISGPNLANPMARPVVPPTTFTRLHEPNHDHDWVPQHRHQTDDDQVLPTRSRSSSLKHSTHLPTQPYPGGDSSLPRPPRTTNASSINGIALDRQQTAFSRD